MQAYTKNSLCFCGLFAIIRMQKSKKRNIYPIMKKQKEFYNIYTINKLVDNTPMKLVLDAESNYRGQLFKLAKKIIAGNKNKVVLLAGPSCAGKTTSAKLLKQILERKNKHVITISMDDFFVNREDTPKLPNGSYDFDSLNAINLDQLQTCFTNLFEKGKAKFPEFNFVTGVNTPNMFEHELKNNTIVLFEGLHVLNPEITSRIGTTKFFKIYANALTGFQTTHTFLTPRNLRLVRRMIRDVGRRGHSPEYTLKMWKDVCDAEDAYIEPFKTQADYFVNTTHSYEVAVYKKELFNLLFNHNEVLRELDFIGLFDASSNLTKTMLPDTTLMWEFIDK